MTRRIPQSQERIMFPAWSVTDNDSPDTYVPQRRRRQQQRKLAARAILLLAALLIVVLTRRRASGTDSVLGAALSEADLRDLHLKPVARAEVASGNPWRGAGRRARGDVIVSVSGCGGTFRPAIASGDVAAVRYSVRGADGALLDESASTADVVVGAGQVDRDMERRLIGLCGGEAVRFETGDRRKVLLYVERVGAAVAGDAAVEDRLAGVVTPVPGRKGRSCASVCRGRGLVCEEQGFRVVNNCPKLREAFGCARCEVAAVGTDGPDMPALVVMSAPVGHARGACLASPRVGLTRCAARYEYTRRLCPCFRKGVVQGMSKR